MSKIFKCKTREGYIIKGLGELLTNNLKVGCFEIKNNGIFLRMFDYHRNTLVDLSLLAENFSIYNFNYETPFFMGLNLNHFNKMLKSIKKKDWLELYIKSDNLTELSIKTIPKENTRITISGIKIQSIQNINIDIPENYRKPIIVQSSEFQKMCKDLNSIGSTNITVISYNYQITFIANADGILKREVVFGESGDSDVDSAEEKKNSDEEIYKATFSTDKLIKLLKIASLSSTLQIFTANKNLPLLLRTNIGTLGKLAIFIKSNEIINQELKNYDNSGSESDE